jgi:hypothetical protein
MPVDKSAKTCLPLVEQLKKMDWRQAVDYGSVKIQVRDGKACKITVEETLILD